MVATSSLGLATAPSLGTLMQLRTCIEGPLPIRGNLAACKTSVQSYVSPFRTGYGILSLGIAGYAFPTAKVAFVGVAGSASMLTSSEGMAVPQGSEEIASLAASTGSGF